MVFSKILNREKAETEKKDLMGEVLKYAGHEENEVEVASLIAKLLPKYVKGTNYMKWFPFWEKNGFHVTPNHYYQPIPDTRTLKDELWERESEMPGVDMRVEAQKDFLLNIFPRFREEYDGFPKGPTGVPHEFHFNNRMFDGTDALVLYCMVRHFKPKRIIECGSGFSTLMSAKAALMNGNTELTSIEPYPSEVLKKGFPGLSRLSVQKIEEVDLSIFSELKDGDILFIDTSHVLRCGNDVHRIYLEIIPRLAPGVIIHVHDIFFPKEYPKSWMFKLYRSWTEQYLLQGFLAFNNQYEVLFCNSYMALKFLPEMKAAFPNSEPFWGGGSFWMRKKTRG
ncbi:MAG: class I SAM-dependent methyltransferase [Thermodesulfobacteriota bacterium]|nr:MAG: class I SAM-dependent methyltransferase [Thermodesulfobacteriota bacterium]